jgi:hypothetical protein
MYALNPAHRRVAHGVRVTAMCWVEGIRPPQPEIRTTRRDAMPFVFGCGSTVKKCYLPPKKCYSVYESVSDGSNIFARRVTVDEYKVPSKMSTNTSLVRTPSTDSHVEVSTVCLFWFVSVEIERLMFSAKNHFFLNRIDPLETSPCELSSAVKKNE